MKASDPAPEVSIQAQAGHPGQPEVEVPTAAVPHVVVKDTTITWDRSEVLVRAGTVVHVRPGGPLWLAYGGEDGLRPVHLGAMGSPDHADTDGAAELIAAIAPTWAKLVRT